MKILFLGPNCPMMLGFLRKDGHDVVHKEAPLSLDDLEEVDYVISYGYRHIIPKEIIEKIRFRGVNLHISLLPWNRGADPNLWSFLEDTPKGVTIHYLDEGLDTGEIIAQREIHYGNDDTLHSTYRKLHDCIIQLFYETWHKIKEGKVICYGQGNTKGSYHRSCDKESYLFLLQDGWETKVGGLIKKGLQKELLHQDSKC